MRRAGVTLAVLVVGVVGIYVAATGVVSATHDGTGSHSENMRLVANFDDGGSYRNGTDIAFWGETAVLGRLDQSPANQPALGPAGPGGFRLLDVSNPRKPREFGDFDCTGDQSDVSIWENLVIVSVDKPTKEFCGRAPQGVSENTSWEGIRVVSIADPQSPRILDTVATQCGSHTNTIYPDLANNRLLVYVLSYPLAGRYNPAGAMATQGCNAAQHRIFSVVEVPLADPAGSKVISTPSTGNTIGCHDVTVFLERKLAGAACLTESQIWDLSNPEHPTIKATIPDERVNIHHSTTFSNDGRTLVIGDELGGAAASPGCLSDQDTYGGLFFYDVSNPGAPERRGTFKLPQRMVSEFCTAHLFNVVPRRDDRNVLVSSWYAGATSVIDFTDPWNPEQIAYYVPRATTSPDRQPTDAAAWASYWYNGAIFSNNFDEDVNSLRNPLSPRSRGLDVFEVDHPLLRKGTIRLSRLNPQLQEPLPGRSRPAR